MSNLDADHSLTALREPLQEVNLFKLLINLADDFQPLGWDKGLKISVVNGDLEKAPQVLAIKPLLSQVFSNIIENAVKYSNRDTEIVVDGSHNVANDSVSVTITNRGNTLPELVVEDRISSGLSLSLGAPRHLVLLRKGEAYTFSYTVAGPRGGYAFESVCAEAGDPLGLYRLRRTFHTTGPLFVFPKAARIKDIPIRPRRTRVYAGSIPARLGGAGIEFFGVRAYQSGDPPRAINWRASARHSVGRTATAHESLFSNEFQQERVADVGIVLDGRQRTNLFGGGRFLFEHSVLAAAALSETFLNQGHRLGLLVYGS